ncbi:MAG: hypothetical protein AAF439_08755 [Pseudomonadota bacterium]
MMRTLMMSGFVTAVLTAGPVAANCVVDMTPAELADEAVAFAPEMTHAPARNFATFALAEMFRPGAADGLGSIPASLYRDVENFGFLTAAAKTFAAGGDATAALLDMTGETESKIARKDMIPAVAGLTGNYDLLQDHFPYGDGTYSQNLNARTPLLMLVQAGQPEAAIEFFFAHKWGYFTHERLDELSIALRNRGLLIELLDLLHRAEVRLKAYRKTGAYELCLERRSEKECQEEDADRARQLWLELFDPGAYQNCWLLARGETARKQCLATIEAQAEAADFPKENVAGEDTFSYLGKLVLLTRNAELGMPRPADVPYAAFRDPGREENKVHAAILVLLAATGEEAAFDAYSQRFGATAGLPTTQGILNSGGLGDGPGLEMEAGLAEVTLADMYDLFDVIAEIAKDPAAHEWVRSKASQTLIQRALNTGDLDAVERWFPLMNSSPAWLLTAAAEAGLTGNPRILNLIRATDRQRICDVTSEPTANDIAWALNRHLKLAAVKAGKIPASALRH